MADTIAWYCTFASSAGTKLNSDGETAIGATLAVASVSLDPAIGAPTALTGPLVLFGDAGGLFAGDLTTVQATNTLADPVAELSVLVGIDVGD